MAELVYASHLALAVERVCRVRPDSHGRLGRSMFTFDHHPSFPIFHAATSIDGGDGATWATANAEYTR